MAENKLTIPIPKHCLGQISARSNASFVQKATLEWTDTTNQKHAYRFVGSGEAREMRIAEDGGNTMVPLHPSREDYSLDVTLTFDAGSSPDAAPVVLPPIHKESIDGRRLRIEIRTEDDNDRDDNDTWLTIELLKGVDPEARKYTQIDPSDHKFMFVELRAGSLLIATGIIVSGKYSPVDTNDFQPHAEYWYLGALTEDYSTYRMTSLQIAVQSTDSRPTQDPSAAIMKRAEVVTWYSIESGGPDLTDPSQKFGVSVHVNGVLERNPQLHVFWYNTAAGNLSLSGQSSWNMGVPSPQTVWHVAE